MTSLEIEYNKLNTLTQRGRFSNGDMIYIFRNYLVVSNQVLYDIEYIKYLTPEGYYIPILHPNDITWN